MNKIICHHNLDWREGIYTIELPVDCEILSIKDKNGSAVLLYLCYLKNLKSSVVDKHKFVVVCHNREVTEKYIENTKYMNTIIVDGGILPVHYFHAGIIERFDRRTQTSVI